MTHACNSTFQDAEAEDEKFKVILIFSYKKVLDQIGPPGKQNKNGNNKRNANMNKVKSSLNVEVYQCVNLKKNLVKNKNVKKNCFSKLTKC